MRTPPRGNAPHPHRLYRDTERGRIMGVCAGIADYLGMEPILIRFGAVLGLIFFSFATVAVYAILAVLLPRRPPRLYAVPEQEQFARATHLRPKVTLAEVRDRFRGLEERLGRMESHVTTREFQLDRAIRDLERGR